jgi:hypothetical protein
LRQSSLLYRGQAQQVLGKIPEAIDSFQRIADIAEVPDAMRNLKLAVTELIKLLIDPTSKFDAASRSVEPWVAKITPAEANDTDSLELNRFGSSSNLDCEKATRGRRGATPTKNLEDKARRTLQATVRVVGDHQEKARSLLAEIGVEPITVVEDKKVVNSFSEAWETAKTNLLDLESAGLSVEILQQQIAATQDATEKSKLEEQIKQAEKDSTSGMKAVSDLLSKALAFYGPEDNRGQLQKLDPPFIRPASTRTLL